MLDKLIINIFDINSIMDSPEIKIYNKDDTTKFGIKNDSMIVTGESKYFINDITNPFGITAIKLMKQLLSNKDIRDSGKFELISEYNQFLQKSEISILSISSNKISASIRLASEDVLSKIPIIKNPSYTAVCNNISTEDMSQLIKSFELLQSNDESFSFEIDDNNIYVVSGNKKSNIIKILCPFLCNSNNYSSNSKFKCKDIITALKIANKFNSCSIKLNNMGLVSILAENDYIYVTINIRGESNEHN